jgi:hypothetical protein
MDATARGDRGVLAVVGAWALVGVAVAASGLLPGLPRAVVPALIAVPAGSFLVGLARSERLRRAVLAMDVRIPIAWQIVRAPIGIVLLALGQRGDLPRAFTTHAGWGDLASGLLAIVALRSVNVRTRESQRFVTAWNALAFLDMLAVVGSAQWLFLVVGDARMEALRRWPTSLLPALVVPLVLMAHGCVTLRQLTARKDARRRTSDVTAA